jgi:UDP-glucose 4-epimerase
MIAVTGASGYIARTLVGHLAARGHAVRALSRSDPPGDIPAGVEWRRVADGLPGAADLAGCDAVVHLAGRAHTRIAVADGRDLFDEANRVLALRTAEVALASGVQRFVFVSTVAVHGTWSAVPVNGASPIRLDSPYARSKWRAEEELRGRLDAGPMQLSIVRPPMVYGRACPGNLARLVRLVASGLPLPLGSAHVARSLIHVENLASYLERCAVHPAASGSFVPGDGSDWTIPELIVAIADALGHAARLVPFPPSVLRAAAGLLGRARDLDSLTRPMLVDPVEAAERLDWRPFVDPGPALRDAVKSHAH